MDKAKLWTALSWDRINALGAADKASLVSGISSTQISTAIDNMDKSKLWSALTWGQIDSLTKTQLATFWPFLSPQQINDATNRATTNTPDTQTLITAPPSTRSSQEIVSKPQATTQDVNATAIKGAIQAVSAGSLLVPKPSANTTSLYPTTTPDTSPFTASRK